MRLHNIRLSKGVWRNRYLKFNIMRPRGVRTIKRNPYHLGIFLARRIGSRSTRREFSKTAVLAVSGRNAQQVSRYENEKTSPLHRERSSSGREPAATATLWSRHENYI